VVLLLIVLLSPTGFCELNYQILDTKNEDQIHLFKTNTFAIETPSDQYSKLSRNSIFNWKYETSEDSYISTPALVDLNGDNNQEIVFITDADAIYAISNSGNLIWKNINYTIDRADQFMSQISNIYYLLPIFSSVTPADIQGDDSPELLLGGKNTLACLDTSGKELWKNFESNKQVISTPVVTDIHGKKEINNTENEIIIIKDEGYSLLNPEIFFSNGQKHLTLSRPGNTDMGFMSLTGLDLDGSRTPNPWEDIIFGSRSSPLRLYLNEGTSYSREIDTSENVPCLVYGTGAVGDFIGDRENEYFIGTYEGSTGLSNPINSIGRYYLYDPINASAAGDEADYRIYSRTLPTGGSGILSSPAIGDVQCGKLDQGSGKVKFEGFLTSYNGRIYCIDVASGSILWSFNTGDRITTSPALCNIDSDDSLEVIVGSNDGMIYCLDGDPTDGVDEGISDSGGSNYDIIWEYDTGGSGFWVSSPVVADINNDNKLEVIIGDMDGVVWCLNAGNVTIPGQCDWPMFQHDITNSGVYPVKEKSFDMKLKLEDGHGINENTCLAKYKPYTFRVEIQDKMGFDDLEFVELVLDPNGYNIRIKWQSQYDTFSETRDPDNLIEITSSKKNSNTDSIYTWKLDFNILFNWTFETSSPISCSIFVGGFANIDMNKYFNNFFLIENDLVFLGEVQGESEFQGDLNYGSWLRGDEEFALTNLYVVYEGYSNAHPSVDDYFITLTDNTDQVLFYNLSSSDDMIYIGTKTPIMTIPNNMYHINISGIPDYAVGPKGKINYLLRIDNTLPEPPQQILLHADSYTDTQSSTDNDTEFFATWTSANVEHSGLMGYYYSTTNGSGTSQGVFTSENRSFSVVEAPGTGSLDLYVWSVDNVGNIGPANKATILIDTNLVTFITPDYPDWINSSTVLIETEIYDVNGSGIDPKTIEYSILKPSSETFSSWMSLNQEIDISWLSEDHTAAKISKDIIFDENGYNYLRWRAQDLAENKHSISDYIRIQIDSKPPYFQYPDLVASSEKDPRIVNCNITLIDDGGSGINASSIEYKYTTEGIMKFSNWQKLVIPNIGDESELDLDVKLTLNYGRDNYIRWRAKDQAGNGYVESENILIHINTPPVIGITSPLEISKMRYYFEDFIEFDARNSFDADDDVLKFIWKTKYTTKLGQEKENTIGHSEHFLTKLQPGYNNITLFVDDGFTNLSRNLDIFVYDKTTDLDEDGIPDWWEERIVGLNPENSNDALLDLDEDGYSNLEEYQRGTNLANSEDYPGKKDSEKDEDDGAFTLYLIYIILLIIVIAILVGIALVKKSKAKKERKKRSEQTQIIMVKRESIDKGFQGSLKTIGTTGTGTGTSIGPDLGRGSISPSSTLPPNQPEQTIKQPRQFPPMNLQSTSQKQTSTIPDDQGSGPDQISSTSNSNGSATQSATQTQQGPQAGSTIKPNKDPDIFADRRKQGGGY
jgi:type II secretory pathway pseudopilin PulG